MAVYWEYYLKWLSEYIKSGLLQIILANITQINNYMDEAETMEYNDFHDKNRTPADQSNPFIEICLNISQQNLIFDPNVKTDEEKEEAKLEQSLVV